MWRRPRSAFPFEIDASAVLRAATSAEKMNVAALGNMVPQLHVHDRRFAADAAWPAPVWGRRDGEPYAETEAARRRRSWRRRFTVNDWFKTRALVLPANVSDSQRSRN